MTTQITHYSIVPKNGKIVPGLFNSMQEAFREVKRLGFELKDVEYRSIIENVKIKNQEVRFMIDTGASDVVIDEKIASKLGYDLKKINYNKVFQTANGQSYGASISFDEVDVSGIKFYNVQASITNSDLVIPLLGMSFLQKFYKYEFYRDKLILTL